MHHSPVRGSEAETGIEYPGIERYEASDRQAPGSKPLLRPASVHARADRMAFVDFTLPDLDAQARFLTDFGLLRIAGDGDDTIFFRCHDEAPFSYRAELKAGAKPAFRGAGFCVGSVDELEAIAERVGLPTEAAPGPGAGRRLLLADPDGFTVTLLAGQTPAEPINTRRSTYARNTPWEKGRINSSVREPLRACPCIRIGHYVLMVSDFQRSAQWYMTHLGLIPSDVQTLTDGTPVMAFFRLDRGGEPADHHTVVLAQGVLPALLHVAFEAVDSDAVGQGQQFLMARGYQHAWGVGRHILGSQFFDYWKDPHGFEFEHYADGDVFDADFPTQYHLADRGTLWQWGDDLPASMRPKPTLRELWAIFSGAKSRRIDMQKLKQLQKAMALAPRPWLK